MGIAYLPDLLDGVFINWDLRVNTCTRVAVPVPDSTEVLSSFVDLTVEAELIAELVHEIHATKTSADDEYFGLQIIAVDIGVATLVGLNQIYVLAEGHVEVMCYVV